MKEFQSFVDDFGIGISKRELMKKAYTWLTSRGHDCYILNEIYLGVDGEEYQVIKSRKMGRWIVKSIRG